MLHLVGYMLCLLLTAEAADITGINVADNVLPEKGSNITIVCDVKNISPFDNILIQTSATSDLFNDMSLTTIGSCRNSTCTSSATRGAESETDIVIFSNEKDEIDEIWVYLSNLQRSVDQKWWHCRYEGNTGTSPFKSMELTIYTDPEDFFTYFATTVVDLSEEHLYLECSTDCMYPTNRSFVWYYREARGPRMIFETQPETYTLLEYCEDYEYTGYSTLWLPRLTTFSDNRDGTVQFQCELTFFKDYSVLTSEFSYNVIFAVQVTKATLTDGVIDPETDWSVTVEVNVTKVFYCNTSVSRPPATVVWYLDNKEVQRSSPGSTFDLIPQHSGTILRCEAFNTQNEAEAVISNNLEIITNETTTEESETSNTGTIVGVVIGVVAAAAIIVIVGLICFYRNKTRTSSSETNSPRVSTPSSNVPVSSVIPPSSSVPATSLNFRATGLTNSGSDEVPEQYLYHSIDDTRVKYSNIKELQQPDDDGYLEPVHVRLGEKREYENVQTED